MSRFRLAVVSAVAVLVAAGAAATLRSAAPSDAPAERDLALATSLVGEEVTVSALERGVIPAAASTSHRARTSASRLPERSVPLHEEAEPAAVSAALAPEVALAEVETPLPPVIAAVTEAAPMGEAVAANVASSGAMALAPGQSVGVTTTSNAGRGSDGVLPAAIFADFRGAGVSFGGGIGGGRCAPRGAGGGALVLR